MIFPLKLKVALEFIGKRGLQNSGTSEERIRYAREILQHKMLPHVGIGEHCETQKAYYFGYIIHQLLCCSLGRRREDDPDHLGNKRLDLAGPLLGGLFQNVFQKFTRNVRRSVQKVVNKGKAVNLQRLITKNAGTITNGLNYSLSAGNVAGRRGVSQPLNRLTYISTLSHLRRFNSPVEHDGGMRFGEMERDCLIGHGAALNLKERLFVVSNPYRAHFCRTCGLIATANLEDGSLQCLPCKSKTNIVQDTMDIIIFPLRILRI